MKELKILPSSYLKQGWNPNHLASDKSGQETSVKSRDTCQYSLWGSVVASFTNDQISAYDCESLRRELLKLIPENYANINAYDTNPYRNSEEIITIMMQAEKILQSEK